MNTREFIRVNEIHHCLEDDRFNILHDNPVQVSFANRSKELCFEYRGASCKNPFMCLYLLITYFKSYVTANAESEELLEATANVRWGNINVDILWCFEMVLDDAYCAVHD